MRCSDCLNADATRRRGMSQSKCYQSEELNSILVIMSNVVTVHRLRFYMFQGSLFLFLS